LPFFVLLFALISDQVYFTGCRLEAYTGGVSPSPALAGDFEDLPAPLFSTGFKVIQAFALHLPFPCAA
jgi:hypothetical protein